MAEDLNIWENKTTVSEKQPEQKTSKPKGSHIDIDIRRILSVWPWVIVFGILGFVAGKIYLRYVTKIYLVTTSINIQQKEEISIGQAFFGSARDPFNDQIAYFRSPTFALQIVDTLGLQYMAVSKGRFKDKEMYSAIKWYVLPEEDGSEIPPMNFSIIAEKDHFEYTANGVKGQANWNQPFSLLGHKVVINKTDDIPNKTPVNLVSIDRITAAFNLSRGISIMPTSESNIVTISYSDISSDRALDILNGLIKSYNNVLLNDKSLSLSQSIDFIDKRIGPLSRELDSIENALAHFKSSQGFIGTSANGEIYLGKLREIDQKRNEIEILKTSINSVEALMNNPNVKEENLSFVGITDSYLQNTLLQYRTLIQEKAKAEMHSTGETDQIKLLDKSISDLKTNLQIQLQNYKRNLNNAEQRNQLNYNEANGMLRSTPMQEKELLGKERMQNLKESLFLTLLQKREEAAIARSGVTVNMKVLTPPVKMNMPAKPSGQQILISTLLIGMVLPIAFAIIKELTNKKVITKKQLQAMTNVSVIAEIEETDNSHTGPFVIEQNERSMIGEQMRTLRTNLNFYQVEKPCMYYMLTSSMSGEGKSFLSLNLARTYSLQGKRVALLEFDLRRPKISKAFNIEKNILGLSSMLVDKVSPKEIIQIPPGVESNEVLHFFPAGIIPPNPQELISSESMNTFKTFLDANYDVVIIDTAPFGIVADAQILGKWADVTLVITRFLLTMNDQIAEINEWEERGVFKKMAIVFNGVKNMGYYGSKYGYYQYKRKYGYNYYTNAPEGSVESKKGKKRFY